MSHQEDPGRMQLFYSNQDALSNLYLSLGRTMSHRNRQATNCQLPPPTCPLTNAAGKRLEPHHLFQAGKRLLVRRYRSPSPYGRRSPSRRGAEN
ncbi:hypothetical protein TNCV_4515301 [Trichonephila clavipes]|nr:hypothetical protein TNCV_4515301 [Trichonephila clavipes]